MTTTIWHRSSSSEVETIPNMLFIMNRLFPLVLVLTLPITSVLWGQTAEINPEQVAAIAEIRKMGGDVRIHEGNTTTAAPGEEWKLCGGMLPL